MAEVLIDAIADGEAFFGGALESRCIHKTTLLADAFSERSVFGDCKALLLEFFDTLDRLASALVLGPVSTLTLLAAIQLSAVSAAEDTDFITTFGYAAVFRAVHREIVGVLKLSNDGQGQRTTKIDVRHHGLKLGFHAGLIHC